MTHFLSKIQKYTRKYYNLLSLLGGTIYNIYGLIIAHGEYLHGSDLCVIPENISIMVFTSRTEIQPMNFSKTSVGRFLCDAEDRKIFMHDKSQLKYKHIYEPLSVIEDLTLDFRIVFDKKQEYFHSGVITDKNIDKWETKPIRDGWENDALSGHDTNIINVDVLKEQIKTKAQYLLSDILTRIHNTYKDKKCIFILYACRGKDGYNSLTELPVPDTIVKKVVKKSLERQESTEFYRTSSDILSSFDVMTKLVFIEQNIQKSNSDGKFDNLNRIQQIRNKIEMTYKISMDDFVFIKRQLVIYKI